MLEFERWLEKGFERGFVEKKGLMEGLLRRKRRKDLRGFMKKKKKKR